MGDVIEIHKARLFSLEDAQLVLPVIRRITGRAQAEVRKLGIHLSYLSDPARRKALEQQIQSTFLKWQEKVEKLGAQAKGMWLVDFDNGEGYFCWHYPEPEIDYFHGYNEGFKGRAKLH